jgi:hypothetical protein
VYRYKGTKWVGTHIKGAVEGDLHPLCGIYHAATGFCVYRTVCLKCANHNAVGAVLLSEADVVNHAIDFAFIIEEVASTGTNQYVHFQIFNGTCRFHQSCGGRNAPNFKGCTEFNARCATASCCNRTLQTAYAYF